MKNWNVTTNYTGDVFGTALAASSIATRNVGGAGFGCAI
jgi:hypothetical protein